MIKYILPFDVLNLILEYDGRIKYIHKDRIYVNQISRNDYRYNIIIPKINYKLSLIKQFNLGNNRSYFYIDICYKNDDIYNGLVLCKKYFDDII